MNDPKPITIEIKMDEKCKRCGKAGATPSGFCLKCLTKAIIAKARENGRK